MNKNFSFEYLSFFNRLHRNEYEEIFYDFLDDVINQYLKRFYIKNHINDCKKNEIFHELEDPVNYFLNNYDEYFELVQFMDDFELTLTFELLYSILLKISENDNFLKNEN